MFVAQPQQQQLATMTRPGSAAAGNHISQVDYWSPCNWNESAM